MTTVDKLLIVSSWMEREQPLVGASHGTSHAQEPVGVAGRLAHLSHDVRGAIETLLAAPARIEEDSARVAGQIESLEGRGWDAIPHLATRIRESLQAAIDGYSALAASLETWELEHCDEADRLARATARGLEDVEEEIADMKYASPLEG